MPNYNNHDRTIQKKTIGLLGGSFNPAHEGHIYISQKAKDLLKLDEVWWLISPQNPLKPKDNMQDFTIRYSSSKKITSPHHFITISDFEYQQQINKTYLTLEKLIKTYQENNFIWLMGADNLIQIDQWYNWQEIFNLLPIAIFDRDDYLNSASSSLAAQKFCTAQIFTPQNLKNTPPPAWCYLKIEKHPLSSSQIRKTTDEQNKIANIMKTDKEIELKNYLQ